MFSIVVKHRVAFGQYSVAKIWEYVYVMSNIHKKYYQKLILHSKHLLSTFYYHLKDVKDGKKRVTKIDFNDQPVGLKL